MEVSTGSDGVARFDRIGCAHLPGDSDAAGGDAPGVTLPVVTRGAVMPEVVTWMSGGSALTEAGSSSR